MRRRQFVSLLAGATTAVFLLAGAFMGLSPHARSQQPAKLPTIGWVQNYIPSFPAYGGFHDGLRALGYVEGQNVHVEVRSAAGDLDRLPDLVRELAVLGVDVLYVGGDQGLRAAKEATGRIPIVVLACDPLNNLVASIARPGGSATGFTCITSELSGKRLELLREFVPQAARLAVLYNPKDLNKVPEYRLVETAAHTLGMTTAAFEASQPSQFAAIFNRIAAANTQALSILADGQFNAYLKPLADHALAHHLPAIYGFKEFAEAGGLISYGANLREEHRLAATYVDKILKGAKPGELPVQEPTKFELVINLKTAKALGLTVPTSLLARADEVIE